MVWRLRYVHIHLADLRAFSAGNAFVRVHLHLEQRDLVKKRVERAQRTQPLAEGAVEQHAQYDHRQQDAKFPCKQAAQCRPDAGIGKGQRDSPLQHALWAEVFAEEWISHAHIVHKECRQQEYHHQQNGILEVSQRFQPLCGKLLRGDFVQQLLKPAKGAQKAADEAPQQNAQQNEKACDIIGEAKLRRAHHCLKRPDGAGPGRRRAGVAVEPRHADGLSRALIQSALEEVRQMQVGQQRRSCLDPAPEAGHGL